MWLRQRRLKLNLALQGGGAHGAFTWGVLDRLLEEDDLDIAWISATSAGALNAVALAAGLAEGRSSGRSAARLKLRAVWDAVVEAGMPEFVRMNPLLNSFTRSGALAQMASLWSPYDFNPINFDPIRNLLEKHIDFARLRVHSPVELLIAATVVGTGATRLFRRHELTVEAVLASACLPQFHHAVQIDGVAYWDGGFSANPDLINLALESPVRDSLIVQLDPLARNARPTSAREITNHVNRLTFNAPLLRDVQLIEAVREAVIGTWRVGGGRLKPLALHRYHLIEAGRYTGSLGPDSKGRPEAAMLSYLHGAGRMEAEKWLGRHKSDIGRRETVDLTARYLRPEPADEPVPASAAETEAASSRQASGG